MSNLVSSTLAFLDVETTGLSPWFGDRIFQNNVLSQPLTKQNIGSMFVTMLFIEVNLNFYISGVPAGQRSCLCSSPDPIRSAEKTKKVTLIPRTRPKWRIHGAAPTVYTLVFLRQLCG
jgi:hypothetical protein